MLKTNDHKFPNNFFWGTATSSHQVEGGQNNDWTEWEPGKINDGSVSGQACDSWNRYSEDFDLIQKLNNNAYRFSIEWSRIEPEEGKWNQEAISRYQKMVLELRQRKIEPFVTLHHFTNPIWFSKKGGWKNSQAPELFGRYCQKMAENLPQVKYWIPLNEPEVYALLSYLIGYWPPQKKSYFKTQRVRKNLVQAHQLAYQQIKKIIPESEIGIAQNLIHFLPFRPSSILDRLASAFADRNYNRSFLNKTKDYLDFIGINYYYPSRLKFKLYSSRNFYRETVPQNAPKSDYGWEIYPEGLGRIIESVTQFKKPLYITENGIADAKDKMRTKFIQDHLAILHKKISDGYDIRGYFYWSLLDNFEWREGYSKKFGLFSVDFKTQERKIRPSGEYYAKVCRDNKL
ncbi:MAG: glycoside hydrolase family 1 protein [Candidatus Kerfeldbacteria bacterium CG_4_10_14_0_8_um_filter_42_10]|uniref:Glycoside hydrolase family 1 protein n=1 Tax=Candidatus Kerfeldbacteria bacterium CG_4_10_14_0_8_um_filter_42_10 TaxID=2014248 RepID=A0A2M7RFW9_9BACT|nr:MAG: glycoside hydrolase family 1 protein [Candidatus Kerfeldbacteria bacterium CG_4_10_14_0_8_um_filter_42_10]